jgi:hypothetical protein
MTFSIDSQKTSRIAKNPTRCTLAGRVRVVAGYPNPFDSLPLRISSSHSRPRRKVDTYLSDVDHTAKRPVLQLRNPDRLDPNDNVVVTLSVLRLSQGRSAIDIRTTQRVRSWRAGRFNPNPIDSLDTIRR